MIVDYCKKEYLEDVIRRLQYNLCLSCANFQKGMCANYCKTAMRIREAIENNQPTAGGDE